MPTPNRTWAWALGAPKPRMPIPRTPAKVTYFTYRMAILLPTTWGREHLPGQTKEIGTALSLEGSQCWKWVSNPMTRSQAENQHCGGFPPLDFSWNTQQTPLTAAVG